MSTLNKSKAKIIGDRLGINWSEINLNEFVIGINIEYEHGARYAETNITNDDPMMTGKIAWAHLKEIPDYYTRLSRMEEEAEAYWEDQRILGESLFTDAAGFDNSVFLE